MADAPAPANPICGVINSLPLGTMVSAPVMAAVDAQFAIAAKVAQYIEQIGLNKDGSVKMVRFSYQQAEMDANGNPTGKSLSRAVDAPFLSIVPIPSMRVEEVNVAFELEVSTAESQSSSTEASASLSGSVGFAWWKVSVSASVTHKSEQTRKTDTRAKYSFDVKLTKGTPPEGLMRIFDIISDAVTKSIPKDKAPALATAS